MTIDADFLREWTRAILAHFDDAITDPTDPLPIEHPEEN